ncbi:helix-turn-helix domain-containing protein [Blautia wexlerae]|uniref:helix-turn-helix domain-containing protein n=1 Tax=Blautia wexlerae TaxID=418240 RepID=UPI00136C5A48|nr:helix-turn-helix domain-containing protein [Blautia wexlerae]
MRKINRAVKIRIYPNKEQITQIEKTIGCSRFLYNRMLADKIRYYQEEKKMLKNTPAGYKKEYPWLKEVDSLALAKYIIIEKRTICSWVLGGRGVSVHNEFR